MINVNQLKGMTYGMLVNELDGKKSVKLTNNTWIDQLPQNQIGIQLHSTYILTYYDNGSISINSGGYQTVTTKQRINALLPLNRVWQNDWEWFIDSTDDNLAYEFYDYIRVDSFGKVLPKGSEYLIDGYNKNTELTGFYRPISHKETLELKYGDTLFFKEYSTNKVRRCRVTSNVKRWKRDKKRFEVSVRYGLYENLRIHNMAENILLMEV